MVVTSLVRVDSGRGWLSLRRGVSLFDVYLCGRSLLYSSSHGLPSVYGEGDHVTAFNANETLFHSP